MAGVLELILGVKIAPETGTEESLVSKPGALIGMIGVVVVVVAMGVVVVGPTCPPLGVASGGGAGLVIGAETGKPDNGLVAGGGVTTVRFWVLRQRMNTPAIARMRTMTERMIRNFLLMLFIFWFGPLSLIVLIPN